MTRRPFALAKGRSYIDGNSQVWTCHGLRGAGSKALMSKEGQLGIVPLAVEIVRRNLRPIKKGVKS